jgi:hypothetical protein
MRVYVSKDGVKTLELKSCEELHISCWKHAIVTYLNFESKPFSKCFTPSEWDTIIINKKVD